MARKNFCDRCTQEIIGIPFTLSSGMKDTFDLCQDCRNKFTEFMKGAEFDIKSTQV